MLQQRLQLAEGTFSHEKGRLQDKVDNLISQSTLLQTTITELNERVEELQDMESQRAAKALFLIESTGKMGQLLEREWQSNVDGVQEKFHNRVIGEEEEEEEVSVEVLPIQDSEVPK